MSRRLALGGVAAVITVMALTAWAAQAPAILVLGGGLAVVGCLAASYVR